MPYQPPDVPTPESLRRVERPPTHHHGARRHRHDVLRTYGSSRRARARQAPPHPLSAAAAAQRRALDPQPTETHATKTRKTAKTRATRAQILAAVRAAYPDQKIGRNDPRVRAAIRNDAHRRLYIEDQP
jgi:hypothetical protein